MAVQITIRNVPDTTRDELAVRAARQGKSMQEYLRAELERLAARPSVPDWLAGVRERKRRTRTRITPEEILRHRDADRR
ncbi:MAG: FitA-like ribbon-helix-helix domain-containing protein [Burkholderiales bacterium]